ncbi:JmjC domain-containing protein [Tsuneonella sp. HG222]
MPEFLDFDSAQFLRESWQKQPLLIRNPWRHWTNPLEPDELAGLACEPEIEARLIRNEGPASWTLEHGPLAPDRFGELGECPWTLLVQAVDHHVPAVAALLEPFRFVPNWRIDDVMVSYAVDGGGVGAHFDQYDVFLVQGLGRRRWRIGALCDDTAPLLPHDGLRLLAEFEPVAEWILEPGDILYVPPGVAHEGVAVGDDCMTYSIGFRAPSRGDLLSGWTDRVLDALGEDDRYADPDPARQANPGEISAEALDRLQALAVGALADRSGFAEWFGEYTTAPKNDLLDWRPDQPMTPEELRVLTAGGAWLERNPASRYAFIRQVDESILLFVDGATWRCAGDLADLAQRLCAAPEIEIDPGIAASPALAELIVDLINRGCLALAEDD